MTTTTNNIDATTLKGFDKLVETGANKDKLEGFLLFEGVPKKVALLYLKECGIIGKESFGKWLDKSAALGFISEGEFTDRLAKGSNNENKHLTYYANLKNTYNGIHAKYSTDIKELMEAEAKVKAKAESEAESEVEPKPKPKHKAKPKAKAKAK